MYGMNPMEINQYIKASEDALPDLLEIYGTK
jgi:hypothetical protein